MPEQRIMEGVWCHECELVTLNSDLGWDPAWEWNTCAHCGELEPGLWHVKGADLATGQHIPTGGDELAAVYVDEYPDDEDE